MASWPRLLASWFLVMAVLVLALSVLDRVPARLMGSTHRAVVHATLPDAERALGTRVWVPPYYPDRLEWPPALIESWPGPPPVVALRIRARGDGDTRLVVCQSIRGAAPPPPRLLPPGEVITSVTVPLGRHHATLERLLAPDGRMMHDLSWAEADRRFTLRYTGPLDELMAMAASLEGAHR